MDLEANKGDMLNLSLAVTKMILKGHFFFRSRCNSSACECVWPIRNGRLGSSKRKVGASL